MTSSCQHKTTTMYTVAPLPVNDEEPLEEPREVGEVRGEGIGHTQVLNHPGQGEDSAAGTECRLNVVQHIDRLLTLGTGQSLHTF